MLFRKIAILFLTFIFGLVSLTGLAVNNASAATEVRLGGMNLSGYCASTGQGDSGLVNNNWTCTNGTTINMTTACQWQYPGQNAFATQTSAGNPYTWTCFTIVEDPTPTSVPNPTVGQPTPTPNQTGPTPTRAVTPTPAPTTVPTPAGARLGGMNLYGYCQSLGRGGSDLSGNTWTCSDGTAIDMNAACVWQYAQPATARQDGAGNPYTWACYAGGSSPVATPTPTRAVTPTPTVAPNPAGPINYLSLGDSFAFGFHLARFQQQVANRTYNPASFNDGFDATIIRNLRGINANVQEVNYACPGETTGSFINGGCAFHSTNQLHNNYPTSQSQLQAAVNFLQTHANEQTLITLDIGVNDAIALANICQAQSNPVACYNQRTTGVLNTIRQNYNTIVNTLQQASTQIQIVLIKAPNPVFYAGTDNLNNGINQIIDQAALTRNLRVADTYSLFTANNVCTMTNYCANPSDFHPNAAGYTMMGNQIWASTTYAR